MQSFITAGATCPTRATSPRSCIHSRKFANAIIRDVVVTPNLSWGNKTTRCKARVPFGEALGGEYRRSEESG